MGVAESAENADVKSSAGLRGAFCLLFWTLDTWHADDESILKTSSAFFDFLGERAEKADVKSSAELGETFEFLLMMVFSSFNRQSKLEFAWLA